MDNTFRLGPQFARDHKQTYYTIYYYNYYYYYFMVEVVYVPLLERLTTVAKYQFDAY